MLIGTRYLEGLGPLEGEETADEFADSEDGGWWCVGKLCVGPWAGGSRRRGALYTFSASSGDADLHQQIAPILILLKPT